MKKETIIITYENRNDYYHTNKTISKFDKVTTFIVSLLFVVFAGGVLFANLINKNMNPVIFSLVLLPLVIFLVAYIFIDANNNNVTNLD